MAKAGRPKANVTKSKMVSVRMTEEEFIKLKKYADSKHRTISEAVHDGIKKLKT